MSKIVILYPFFKCKGGGEKLLFQIRNHYKADLYTPVIHPKEYNKSLGDQFNKELFDPNYKLFNVSIDLDIPIIRLFWRQLCGIYLALYLRFVIKPDIVISSGNLFGMQRLLGKNIKKINYCNTPPRIFTDQKTEWLAKFPAPLDKIAKIMANILLKIYIWDIKANQIIIANSENIQKRLWDYLKIESVPIFVPVDIDRFKYIETGDYYLTFGRLEEIKRIKLIVQAFMEMPDKKLIVCSGGPLKNWLEELLKTGKYPNIKYLGLVSDQELNDLVGKCLTGIYIPKNEDAGMVQIELMSAGKPAIGVAEGGLLETIENNKSGFLLKSNPTVEDLKNLVKSIDSEKIKSMKDTARNRAEMFSTQVFFEKLDKQMAKLITQKTN